MRTLYLFLACLFTVQAFANKVYVSKMGQNSNDGTTADRAFKSIAVAVQHAGAGDTVYVLGGIYPETTEIRIDKPLSLLNYEEGISNVVIDGTAIDTVNTKDMIFVYDTHDVVIRGFNFQRYICNGAKAIWVLKDNTDAGQGFTIKNCKFTDIGWLNNDANPGFLSVYPADTVATNVIRIEGRASTPVAGVTIAGNTIQNCATGRGEAITVTGNVQGFLIDSNLINGISNIGIDAAGNYYTKAPNEFNQARDGIISRNTVSNCMSPVAPSAGIYLDGSKNIVVRNNTVYNNAIGIAVSSEDTITATNGKQISGWHNIYNNLVYGNAIGGINLGDEANNVNYPVTHVTVYNNTFYKNRTGAHINGVTTVEGSTVEAKADNFSGEIQLKNIDSLAVENNIIYPLQNKKGLTALYGFNIRHFSSNYNDYYRDDASPLIEIGNGIIGFNGSRKDTGDYATPAQFFLQTGLEKNSVNADPVFTNAASHQFTLTANSKAVINKGDTVKDQQLYGITDLANKPRIYDGRIDIGAYEYQSTVLALQQVQFFNIFALDKKVVLAWNLIIDNNTGTIDVEHSTDGIKFKNKALIPAQQSNYYEWTDNVPAQGFNYYRIKVTKPGGDVLYSAVKSINFKNGSGMLVYPNPVKNGKFTINTTITAGRYNSYILFTMQGKIAATGQLKQATQPVYIPGLAGGAYILKLSTGEAIRLIIQ